MEENVRKTDELSLFDILKLFWRHIKLLLLVLLGGIIVGASIGAISKANIDYYGTSLTFYVNPYIDETAEDDGTGSTTTDSQYGVYGAYGKHVMDNMVKLLSSELFSEILIQDVPNLPEKIVDGKLNSKYENLLMTVQNSVSFSYYGGEDDASDVDSLARSFIYVNISVLNSESLAQYLMESVLAQVPVFVEENMTVPNGYDGTNCRTTNVIHKTRLLNEGEAFSTAVTDALIFGFGALIIVCIALIVIDRSDKRLRSVDQITETFNVPVLGVIPTIEKKEPHTENQDKNENAEVQE